MIRDGRVITSGDVDRLVRGINSGKILTLDIRTLRPVTQQIVSDLEHCGGVSSAQVMGECSIRLEFSGSVEEQAHVTETVFRSGLGVLSMNEKGADLESLYMNLTKGDEIQ